MQQLEQLAAALTDLPGSIQNQLPCPEEIITQVRAAAAMKSGARKRQIKYLTKLLHSSDTQEELYSFIAQHKGSAIAAQKEHHQLELYRNALIEEALDRARENDEDNWGEQWQSRVVEELKSVIPQVDEKALLKLAYRFAKTRNPRHSREIFRTLRSALEQQKRAAQPVDSAV